MAFMLLASSQPTACAVFSSRGDQRVRVDPRRIDPAVTFGVYPFPDFIARRMRAELPFLYLVLEQLGSSRGASPGESVEHVVGVRDGGVMYLDREAVGWRLLLRSGLGGYEEAEQQ